MKNKKYYWLKLKNNFFEQLEIKKLRRIAGGDTFTIIYLKLQLLSLQNEGKIYFEGIEDNIINELSLQIDEDIENVKLTFLYLQNHGLIEKIEEDEYFLTKIPESIGKESDSAERMRKLRGNQKMVKTSHCYEDVRNSYTEIEIDKEKELKKEIEKKNKHLDAVLLTNGEYDKLIEKYETKEKLNKGLETLNNYLMSTGKKYKSHYHVMIGWVLERIEENEKHKYHGSPRNDTKTPKPIKTGWVSKWNTEDLQMP